MWTRAGVPTKVVAMPSATYFPQATELKFSAMLLGWSTGTGEASSSLKALVMTYNQRQGLRRHEPRPLLERQGRRADRGRAADGRRRQARGVPAARDRDPDRRPGHHPAALPGEQLGDARRHHVRAARRRDDARVEVQARRARRSERAGGRAGRRSRRRRATSSRNAWVDAARRRRRCRWSIRPTARRSRRIARGTAADIDAAVRGRAAAQRRRVGPARAGRARAACSAAWRARSASTPTSSR